MDKIAFIIAYIDDIELVAIYIKLFHVQRKSSF